jgi:hypothetical protein
MLLLVAPVSSPSAQSPWPGSPTLEVSAATPQALKSQAIASQVAPQAFNVLGQEHPAIAQHEWGTLGELFSQLPGAR